VRVANASGRRELGRQSNRCMPEDRAASRRDMRVEPTLELCGRLIGPDSLVIRFAEEEHATHPGQSGLLVRDRDLLGELMLKLELVRPYQVGAVGIR